MIEFLKQPWHWAISGIIIGLVVPALLLLGNKSFGISSSLRDICAMCIPAKIPFFQYNWKDRIWNFFFVGGIVLGGLIASQFLTNPNDMVIAHTTKGILEGYGISDFSGLLPMDVFNWDNLFTARGLIFFVLGGFMVGFGTRYAGGCTSGHSIMGLSALQLPSLYATLSFMVGGWFCTQFIIPLIFNHF